MKLYFAPGTISIAVAIALNEAGVSYDTHQLDFATGEQRGDGYAAVNPKGRVPALDVDGTILTETGAILDYVATLAPDLMPADPVAAAKARGVMYYLASTMHVAHAHGRRANRWADEKPSWADMAAKMPQNMTECAAFVEAACLRGPYIFGDTMCVADAYLFVVCSWLTADGVDLAPFPKVRAFLAAMEARPSVQTVRANGMLP
ncbi:MAG: glutathione S-transferase family protein [Pseudomonadota bacterium]